jgi:hypothetical protein
MSGDQKKNVWISSRSNPDTHIAVSLTGADGNATADVSGVEDVYECPSARSVNPLHWSGIVVIGLLVRPPTSAI